MVIGLSLEILQSIQQAEQQAEEARQNAQREARDVIKSVEAACATDERTAAIEHRALYQKLMDEHRLKVEAELKEKSKAQEQERAALCREAETRLDAAATLIFERIVNHGHC